MRDIKFRGRAAQPGTKWHGKWFYGFYVFSSGSHLIHEGDSGSRGIWTVDPDTVGQFTGLKDRNGKEIYDGDILLDAVGVGEVKWMLEHCAFLVRTIDPHQYHRLESDGQLKTSEIIGNVYENPELLRKAGEPA